MSTEEPAASPEREKTDEGLREEREKTDLALASTQEALEEDADAVVERARQHADAILTTAREKADEQVDAAVVRTPRPRRSMRGAPSSSSSALTCCDSAGWVT